MEPVRHQHRLGPLTLRGRLGSEFACSLGGARKRTAAPDKRHTRVQKFQQIRIILYDQANGSLIFDENGEVIGSRLIGQQWNGAEWFHGRPSATTGSDLTDPTKTIMAPYNAANSGGSNLGRTSRILIERLTADRNALDQTEPEMAGKAIPADMLTTPASGLDPDISPAYAALQVHRVAAARGVTEEQISAVLARHIAGRTLGIFGEPRVNVLELNLDLRNH
jgi:K+-transporting ATPase ATPase C chain